MVIDRSYCAGWRTLTPHKGNDRITYCSVNMVRHPEDSFIVIPTAVSGVATPENKVQLIGAVINKQESRHKVPEVRRTSGSWKDAVHPSCDSPNTSRAPTRVDFYLTTAVIGALSS